MKPARFTKTVLATVISALVLSACGGGGGGGASPAVRPSDSTPTAVATKQVPFSTPVRVGELQPSVQSYSTQGRVTVGDYEAFAVDLTGKGYDDVVVAGRLWPFTATQTGSWGLSQLKVYSFENSTLVDKTSTWFTNVGDNYYYGVEDSIKVGNFDGSGRKSIYTAPYNDGYAAGSTYDWTKGATTGGTQVYGDGTMFINNGTSFVRINVPIQREISQSVVYDMNKDGIDDIYQQSYWGTVITFGSNTGNFKTYYSTGDHSGVGAAVADFMGDGTATFIVTEDGPGASSRSSRKTNLYSWAIDSNDQLNLTKISELPTRRFLLPQWSSYNFSGAHDVAALAFNFDNAGLTDALVFSRPDFTNGVWPKYSEVQFLRNDGAGVFTDVTDTTLVGYNTASESTMNPTLADVNNDGLTDVVLGTSTGVTVLVHTTEHKYVASYTSVLNAFQTQAGEMEKAVRQVLESSDNYVTFVKGPDNNVYLVTMVSINVNNTVQKALYMTKVGTNTPNAQATVTSLKQIWPWMSDAQINQTLANSSITYFGLNLLDPIAALAPVGELKIQTTGGTFSIGGSVSGINVNGMSSIKVFDSVSRDFDVNLTSSKDRATNLWEKHFTDQPVDDTRSIANLRDVQSSTANFNGTTIKTSYNEDQSVASFGVTNMRIAQDVRVNAQVTSLPYSPFVQMSGMWGTVKESKNFEMSASFKSNDFVIKGGVIISITEINKGLVEKVSPITALWAEAGYATANTSVMAGVFPTVVNGAATVSLPTGVNTTTGQVQFTSTKANVEGVTVGYTRAQHVEYFKDNKAAAVSAIVTSTGNYGVAAKFEMKF